MAIILRLLEGESGGFAEGVGGFGFGLVGGGGVDFPEGGGGLEGELTLHIFILNMDSSIHLIFMI